MSKYNQIEEYLLQGLTWGEMLDLGITDTDRKKFYGYKDAYVDYKLNEIYANEKQKLRIAKKELSIERQINNEQLKYITEHKLIHDKRKGTKIIDLEFSNDYGNSPNSWFIYVLSDFHFNGDNNTLEVLSTVRNEIIKHILDNGVQEMVLVELGDVVEGATLRPSQLMAIKSGLVEQTLTVAYAYKQMIESIIVETGVRMTLISTTSSNHTQLRNLGTKRNELPREDMMLVFNDIVKQSSGLSKFIEGDEVLTKIGGYDIYFAHGHTVKNKKSFVKDVGQRLNTIIDYALLGHIHHTVSETLARGFKNNRNYDIKLLFNPSLCKHESQFEKDLNLTSAAGFNIYEFNNTNGNIGIKKIYV